MQTLCWPWPCIGSSFLSSRPSTCRRGTFQNHGSNPLCCAEWVAQRMKEATSVSPTVPLSRSGSRFSCNHGGEGRSLRELNLVFPVQCSLAAIATASAMTMAIATAMAMAMGAGRSVGSLRHAGCMYRVLAKSQIATRSSQITRPRTKPRSVAIDLQFFQKTPP